MTWSAHFAGHALDAEKERLVLDVLENAADEIRGILGPGNYGSYSSQHHGSGSLHGPGGVETLDEPAPVVPPPGGVGLGSGNATSGGEGSGGQGGG